MRINDNCIGCTMCVDECKLGAIVADANYNYKIDKDICIDCGDCLDSGMCDNNAIERD